MIKNYLCIMIGAIYICIGYYLFARPEVTVEMADNFIKDSLLEKANSQEIFYRSLILDHAIQSMKYDSAYKEFLSLQKTFCTAALSQQQSILLQKKQVEWHTRIASYLKAQALLKLYQMDEIELTKQLVDTLQRWVISISKYTTTSYATSFCSLYSEAIKKMQILCSEINKKLPEEQRSVLVEAKAAIEEGLHKLQEDSAKQAIICLQKAIALLLSLQNTPQSQAASFTEQENKLPTYTLEELFSLYLNLNKEEMEALHK